VALANLRYINALNNNNNNNNITLGVIHCGAGGPAGSVHSFTGQQDSMGRERHGAGLKL